jgi:hypothetical protein
MKDATKLFKPAGSEYLPIGTEITFTLQIREGSPFLDLLPTLLEMGKNNGIGQWSGSGRRGRFMYKCEDCEDPSSKVCKVT